mmetsp:Transcript_91467/g.158572  ORF Transcript_91467/g.158572 Transcript_91467/m.158572 type:complete len:179 (+) Transcript_91467:3003-3539(+)
MGGWVLSEISTTCCTAEYPHHCSLARTSIWLLLAWLLHHLGEDDPGILAITLPYGHYVADQVGPQPTLTLAWVHGPCGQSNLPMGDLVLWALASQACSTFALYLWAAAARSQDDHLGLSINHALNQITALSSPQTTVACPQHAAGMHVRTEHRTPQPMTYLALQSPAKMGLGTLRPST